MSWTHLGDSTPVARKIHRCYLCGEIIPAGERYVSRRGIFDSELSITKMHTECEKESQSFDVMDWEVFSEGDMPRPKYRHSPMPVPDHSTSEGRV